VIVFVELRLWVTHATTTSPSSIDGTVTAVLVGFELALCVAFAVVLLMHRPVQTIGFSAIEMSPLTVLASVVTEVFPNEPVPLYVPVARQCPPPRPMVFDPSPRSVRPLRFAFDQLEQFVESVALSDWLAIAMTRVSATPVEQPGIEPEVSLDASTPPAVQAMGVVVSLPVTV
jgi:hypothetical protein